MVRSMALYIHHLQAVKMAIGLINKFMINK